MVDSARVALIADVVGSRTHADRAEVQRCVEATLSQVASLVPPSEPFSATVGDELQAIYRTRGEALRATLYASLLSHERAELRFGLGQGEVRGIPSTTSDRIQDGPGWWRAREAIEELHHRQQRLASLRSWFVGTDAAGDAVVNAYVMTRDRLLADLSVSARNYARGMLEGLTQKEIAREYGVSQPAVSKLLRNSGANVVLEGFAILS